MINLIQPDYKPVYILGAGASHMIGGPLLKDFMARAREIRYSSYMRDYKLVNSFTNYLYQSELFKSKAFIGSDLDNLENLFSMLDMEWQSESVSKNPDRYNELTSLREDFITLVIYTLKDSVNKSNSSWDTYKTHQFFSKTRKSKFYNFQLRLGN